MKTNSWKEKTFPFVSDGYGGMVVPMEVIDVLLKDRRATPADKNFRQTADMLVYEACAGTVVKVTKHGYVANISQDGKQTVKGDDRTAKVGDRILSVSAEDGSGFTVAVGPSSELAEYNDGESVVLAITPTENKKAGSLAIIPTVEKHVAYPRMATLDGVEYPYLFGPDENGESVPYVVVQTEKGWTIGGELVQAQHAWNVAVTKADNGGAAPKKLNRGTKTVLFVVKNLTDVVKGLRKNPDAKVTIDEEFIEVNQTTIRKQLKRDDIFGGAVFTKNHDPKLAHGWYKQPADDHERAIFNQVFGALYGQALKDFTLAPVETREQKAA